MQSVFVMHYWMIFSFSIVAHFWFVNADYYNITVGSMIVWTAGYKSLSSIYLINSDNLLFNIYTFSTRWTPSFIMLHSLHVLKSWGSFEDTYCCSEGIANPQIVFWDYMDRKIPATFLSWVAGNSIQWGPKVWDHLSKYYYFCLGM